MTLKTVSGGQLTGWGGASRKQKSRINGLCCLNFFDLSKKGEDRDKREEGAAKDEVKDQQTCFSHHQTYI